MAPSEKESFTDENKLYIFGNPESRNRNSRYTEYPITVSSIMVRDSGLYRLDAKTSNILP
jgi:hypothetical protein